jgi:hypothetical protein
MGGGRGKTRRHKIWIAVMAAAAACACLIVVAVAQGDSQPTGPQPGPQPVVDPACANAVKSPYTQYDLGDSFAGLPRTDTSQMCEQPPPAGAVGSEGDRSDDHGDPSSGTGPVVPFTSTVYGDCHAEADGGGCPLPLEIQSWPQCHRNAASYGDLSGDELNQREKRAFKAAPSIPVESFEDGTHIELYTGDTTIVVFADDPALASQAADALAQNAAAANSGSGSNDLWREADDPRPQCHGENG